jgi:hypothetical protein
MDTSVIILIAIIVLPIVVLMTLRINAALVFLSLCLGAVLTQYVADDAGFLMTLPAQNVPQTGSMTLSTIKLGLLLLPVVLTAIFMIRTVRGPRLILNVLPAAGVGLLGALLAVPFLPAGTAASMTSSTLWHQVTNAQDLIVGASALLCLFVLWLQRAKSGGEGRRHE